MENNNSNIDICTCSNNLLLSQTQKDPGVELFNIFFFFVFAPAFIGFIIYIGIFV